MNFLGLAWPLAFWLLALCLVWWDRRPWREAFPFLLTAPLAAGLAFLWQWLWPSQGAWARISPSSPLGLTTVVLLATLTWARWPIAETSLDVLWLGLGMGCGAGVGLGVAWPWQQAAPHLWLAFASPAVGAVIGALWGTGWCWGKRWLLWLVLPVSAASGLSVSWLFLWLGRQLPGVWVALALSLSLTLLALAFALWCERQEVGRQLAEEVSFGLLPPKVARLASRLEARCGRQLSPRWDERRALAHLLLRLAACKSYLARQGKKQSTAAVELGKLRERARRVFSPQASEVELALLA